MNKDMQSFDPILNITESDVARMVKERGENPVIVNTAEMMAFRVRLPFKGSLESVDN